MSDTEKSIAERLIENGLNPQERMEFYAIYSDCDIEVHELLKYMRESHTKIEMEIIRTAASNSFGTIKGKIKKLRELLDRLEEDQRMLDKFKMMQRI